MTDKAETFAINQAEEAFVRDFCPYKGSPDPLVVWKAAWKSCRATKVAAPQAAQVEPVVTLESALRAIAHLSFSNSAGREAEARAMLAERPQGPTTRSDALTWYDGAPPFPQDQEWFIAETIHGDRVVLRSMDEGREHKGNYAFKTADETYMKAEIIKRWMQFPDCDYVPPEADPNAPWLTEAHMLCSDHGIPAGHITDRLRALRQKLDQPSPAHTRDELRALIENYANAKADLALHPTDESAKIRFSIFSGKLGPVLSALRQDDEAEPLNDRQKAVLSFLYGTGTISGVGFGQKPPGVSANYWWRHELAEAFPALRDIGAPESN